MSDENQTRARVRESILEAVDVRIAYGEPVWTIDDVGVDRVLDAAHEALARELDWMRRDRQEAARRIEELERQREAVLALCEREPCDGCAYTTVDVRDIRAIYGGGR